MKLGQTIGNTLDSEFPKTNDPRRGKFSETTSRKYPNRASIIGIHF